MIVAGTDLLSVVNENNSKVAVDDVDFVRLVVNTLQVEVGVIETVIMDI